MAGSFLKCYTFSMKLEPRLLKNIQNIFKHLPQIVAVYLYGSRMGGYAAKGSDLDIAIIVDDIQGINYDQLYAKISKIIMHVELDLRVVTFKDDPTYLFEVIKGQCIYQRSDRDKINLETRALRNFYDGQHIRDIYYYYLKQSFGVSSHVNR